MCLNALRLNVGDTGRFWLDSDECTREGEYSTSHRWQWLGRCHAEVRGFTDDLHEGMTQTQTQPDSCAATSHGVISRGISGAILITYGIVVLPSCSRSCTVASLSLALSIMARGEAGRRASVRVALFFYCPSVCGVMGCVWQVRASVHKNLTGAILVFNWRRCCVRDMVAGSQGQWVWSGTVCLQEENVSWFARAECEWASQWIGDEMPCGGWV